MFESGKGFDWATAEQLAFALLLISAIFISLWSFMVKHKGILFLQLFYVIAGIIGMIRWFE